MVRNSRPPSDEQREAAPNRPRSDWWLLALLAASVGAAQAQEPPSAATDWIRKNAILLKTEKAGHGFEDLLPLKELIGEARIVALGEPSHGTHEAFQMKHRLLEFLVEELGFSVFSIEGNLPESFRLNDYVLRGEGDPRELIRGMGAWIWATEEVREMVEWMRGYNVAAEAEGRPRVTFTGFDVQVPDVAAKVVAGFIEKADPGYAPAVREAAKAAMKARRSRGGQGFGTAWATFPVARASGRRLSYRGWIRTDGLRDGYAGLFWRCDVEHESRALDDMQDRGPRGTTEWQRFDITMAVPAEATGISFGVLMTGRGTAWFDGLEIALDGEPVVDPPFDLDFEGRRLRGLATPAAYRVELDRAVAKTGRQSLRIRGAPPAGWTDPLKEARQAWQAVVTRLEGSRGAYRQEGDLLALEWAIVNARLVGDSIEARSEISARDRAMARMVGWILDQSPPQARIVLWAHNLHVQRQPGWMGRFLEEAFPGQTVVLGFATGEGTYRAASKSGRGVKTYGLAPPPPDSFERAFQAARLPRFVLDLRKALPGSPESGWLLERRRFRAIGSTEQREQFRLLRIRDSFDAVVWIEKTTASVPLAN